MKKTLLFLTLLFWVSVGMKLSAQTEWAPLGAKWYYEFPYNYNNAETFITIESIGDTVINGITCKILEQECIREPFINRIYYTYKADDKVWVYDGTEFRLLYDFTVPPQGEFTAYGPHLYGICDSVTNVKVESAGFEEINGISLKYMTVVLSEFGWYFSLYNDDPTKISEKFGSYGFMFPQENCAIDVPGPTWLRCYEDSEFGFFTTGVSDSCTYEYGVGVKEIELADNIKIGPNPVSGILNIELKGNLESSNFSIYSSTGKLIYKALVNSQNTQFDITAYKPGTYVLKIFHEGVFRAGKIVKM